MLLSSYINRSINTVRYALLISLLKSTISIKFIIHCSNFSFNLPTLIKSMQEEA